MLKQSRTYFMTLEIIPWYLMIFGLFPATISHFFSGLPGHGFRLRPTGLGWCCQGETPEFLNMGDLAGWGPPYISWFINHCNPQFNYSYIYIYLPFLATFLRQLNAIDWGPPSCGMGWISPSHLGFRYEFSSREIDLRMIWGSSGKRDTSEIWRDPENRRLLV